MFGVGVVSKLIGGISEGWGYMPDWLGGGWARKTTSIAEGVDGADDLMEGITKGDEAGTVQGVTKIGGATARWFTSEFLSETLHLPNFIAQPLSLLLETLIKPLIEMGAKYVGGLVKSFKSGDKGKGAEPHENATGKPQLPPMPNQSAQGARQDELHAQVSGVNMPKVAKLEGADLPHAPDTTPKVTAKVEMPALKAAPAVVAG